MSRFSRRFIVVGLSVNTENNLNQCGATRSGEGTKL